jgi:hypothetical protein
MKNIYRYFVRNLAERSGAGIMGSRAARVSMIILNSRIDNEDGRDEAVQFANRPHLKIA